MGHIDKIVILALINGPARDLGTYPIGHMTSMSLPNRNILTDFKNATLTSLYIFQKTVVCKILLLR